MLHLLMSVPFYTVLTLRLQDEVLLFCQQTRPPLFFSVVLFSSSRFQRVLILLRQRRRKPANPQSLGQTAVAEEALHHPTDGSQGQDVRERQDLLRELQQKDDVAPGKHLAQQRRGEGRVDDVR